MATASFGASGGVTISAATGASVAPTYPANGVANRHTFVCLDHQKPQTLGGGGIATMAGWTANGSLLNAGGYASQGIDAGNSSAFAFTKDAITGSEGGTTVTQTLTDNNMTAAMVFRIDADADVTGWSVAVASGSQTVGGNVNITCSSDPGIQAGDLLILFFCGATDAATYSAEGVTQAGVTFGPVTERHEWPTTVGQDGNGFVATVQATAGTSSAPPVVTATTGGTTTNARGPLLVVRVRGVVAAGAAKPPTLPLLGVG
jgi:hypothetical protein